MHKIGEMWEVRRWWMKSVGLLWAAVGLFAAPAQTGQSSNGLVDRATATAVDRLSEGWWAARHAVIVKRVETHPDIGLIVVGDSITQNYEKSNPPDENFQPTWQHFYGQRKALNLGFSGDTTANVLWRLEHGEVDGLHPKVAILLIGTNDTGHAGHTPLETEAGIDADVMALEQKLPQTNVLLVSILPSDLSEKKSAADRQINEYLADRYAIDSRVTYLDVGSVFRRGDELDTSIFYDPRLPHPGRALHPDTLGQRQLAEAIEPTLTHLLNDAGQQYLASLDDVNNAIIPVPRLEMDSYDWYERHHDVLAAGKRLDPQIVLIGDSITHFWAGPPKAHIVNGPASWEGAFGDRRVLNLGFGWDRTQNVLWRLTHGEFDGLHPRTVVINIGTNNLTGTKNCRPNTPAEVVAGVLAIHESVRAKAADARIIVMGVFPRGPNANSPLREPILQVNRLLAAASAEKPGTTFLDIGSSFLQPDGTLPKDMMNDGTHPSEGGYAVWAKALIAAGIRK